VEVSPLSRGVTFKPLSRPLQPGVRFFHHPLPAFPAAFLAIGLPTQFCGRKYGLTQFHASNTNRLGPASSPTALCRRVSLQKETSGRVPFGSGALRCFRPALITVFIGNSLTLTLLSSLTPCPFATNERIPIPRETGISPWMRHYPGASHATVTSHALPIGYG
jgi:hypothetical protein